MMSKRNEANESCKNIVENVDKPEDARPFIDGYWRRVLIYLCVFGIAIVLISVAINLGEQSHDCSSVSTNQTSSAENRHRCR